MKEFKPIPLGDLIVVGSSIFAQASAKHSISSYHVVQLPIIREANRYVADVNVGSSQEKVNITIDVGSDFTWISLPDAELCAPHSDNHTAGACAETQSLAHGRKVFKKLIHSIPLYCH